MKYLYIHKHVTLAIEEKHKTLTRMRIRRGKKFARPVDFTWMLLCFEGVQGYSLEP
jgi:hypothetical protein